MIDYITVEQVDEKLGDDWASSDTAKTDAVMMVNVWLTNLNLPSIDDNQNLSNAVLSAAVKLIPDAVSGELFKAKEVGVLSESVSAQSGTNVSSKYASTYKSYTASENLAMAILKPWINSGLGDVILIVKI